MSFCTNCGSRLGIRDETFCTNCGSPVLNPIPPYKGAGDTANPTRNAGIEQGKQAALGCRFGLKLIFGLFIVITGVGMLPFFPVGTVIGVVVAVAGFEIMRSQP